MIINVSKSSGTVSIYRPTFSCLLQETFQTKYGIDGLMLKSDYAHLSDTHQMDIHRCGIPTNADSEYYEPVLALAIKGVILGNDKSESFIDDAKFNEFNEFEIRFGGSTIKIMMPVRSIKTDVIGMIHETTRVFESDIEKVILETTEILDEDADATLVGFNLTFKPTNI